MQKLIDLIRDHRRRHASHSGDDWTDHDLEQIPLDFRHSLRA
jgi:hypothetical protein